MISPKLIDTHAHLESLESPENAIERALKEDLEAIITINTNLKSFDPVLQFAITYTSIYCALGIHPSDFNDYSDDVERRIEAELVNKKVVGIGEIGLDYYWEKDEKNRKLQRDVFAKQIQLAKKQDLPMVIHNRNADNDTINVLKEISYFKGVFHCFSGTIVFAKQLLDLGLDLSFTGIVTFKKSVELHETVKYVPLDRMMVETDSPYLSPEPCRGKKNEPTFVKYIAMKIAELKGRAFEEVVVQTTLNAKRLFGIV